MSNNDHELNYESLKYRIQLVLSSHSARELVRTLLRVQLMRGTVYNEWTRSFKAYLRTPRSLPIHKLSEVRDQYQDTLKLTTAKFALISECVSLLQ